MPATDRLKVLSSLSMISRLVGFHWPCALRRKNSSPRAVCAISATGSPSRITTKMYRENSLLPRFGCMTLNLLMPLDNAGCCISKRSSDASASNSRKRTATFLTSYLREKPCCVVSKHSAWSNHLSSLKCLTVYRACSAEAPGTEGKRRKTGVLACSAC